MNELHSVLAELMKTLEQSVTDYRNYIVAGKTFRHAQLLKLNNGKSLLLLFDLKKKFPAVLQSDVNALIHHYTVWTHKWEELAAALNPGPDDEFVFPNTVTFPREAAQRLENCYREMTG
jgi:hypothetical protein